MKFKKKDTKRSWNITTLSSRNGEPSSNPTEYQSIEALVDVEKNPGWSSVPRGPGASGAAPRAASLTVQAEVCLGGVKLAVWRRC